MYSAYPISFQTSVICWRTHTQNDICITVYPVRNQTCTTRSLPVVKNTSTEDLHCEKGYTHASKNNLLLHYGDLNTHVIPVLQPLATLNSKISLMLLCCVSWNTPRQWLRPASIFNWNRYLHVCTLILTCFPFSKLQYFNSLRWNWLSRVHRRQLGYSLLLLSRFHPELVQWSRLREFYLIMGRGSEGNVTALPYQPPRGYWKHSALVQCGKAVGMAE